MKNKRSKNDEIPRGIWKVIKAKVRKIGIAKAKAKRKQRKKKRNRREKNKRREDNKNKKVAKK